MGVKKKEGIVRLRNACAIILQTCRAEKSKKRTGTVRRKSEGSRGKGEGERITEGKYTGEKKISAWLNRLSGQVFQAQRLLRSSRRWKKTSGKEERTTKGNF